MKYGTVAINRQASGVPLVVLYSLQIVHLRYRLDV